MEEAQDERQSHRRLRVRIYGTRASKAATDSFYKAVERIVDDEASDWEEYRAARAAYIDQVRLDLKVSDV